jgi:hypothetical protein
MFADRSIPLECSQWSSRQDVYGRLLIILQTCQTFDWVACQAKIVKNGWEQHYKIEAEFGWWEVEAGSRQQERKRSKQKEMDEKNLILTNFYLILSF